MNQPTLSENAWQVMDDWCRTQGQKLLARTNPHILKGRDLNDREFRRLLGQSQGIPQDALVHSRNAQGIEAPSGGETTKIGSTEGESPVASAMRPKQGIGDSPSSQEKR